MGTSKYFKEKCPGVKVIAVDVQGSIIFGADPKERRIPGMGSSRVPDLLDMEYVDDYILRDEDDTIRMCYEMLNSTGILFGGSTCTVLSGIKQYFKNKKIHTLGEILHNKIKLRKNSPDRIFFNPMGTVITDLGVAAFVLKTAFENNLINYLPV